MKIKHTNIHKLVFWAMIFVNHTFSLAQNQKIVSSSVNFKIKHALGSTADGSFKGFVGTINFNPNDLANSLITASVESKTIDTDLGMRDKAMRDVEYFDVTKYPKITMTSTRFEKTAKPNEFIGYFNLSIKKTVKNLKIPFTFVQNGTQMTFKSSFSINRIEFGVGEKSSLLSDTANLSINIITQQ